MAAGNVHVAGEVAAQTMCITLHDAHGPVQFFALPYADPPFVRDRLGDAGVSDHDSAMECCVRSVLPRCAAAARNVLVAHAFVVGGQESESERPLSVGGAGTVSAGHFAPFTYTALGHLHRPQKLNGGSVCYSGSLLKYSFDEATHTKSLSIVEIDPAGKVAAELVSLRPRRDVRCIEGAFRTILEDRSLRTEDYVKVRLTDSDLLFEPLNRLRECFPNVLDLDYAYRDPKASQEVHRVDHTKTGPVDLFKAFYQYVEDTPLSAEQTLSLTAVVERLEKEHAQ
jgi:exonuclease SbcD